MHHRKVFKITKDKEEPGTYKIDPNGTDVAINVRIILLKENPNHNPIH